MLHEFLMKNEQEILKLTERKTLELAGGRPSSEQLKKGLPIFFQQLLVVLQLEASNPTTAEGKLNGNGNGYNPIGKTKGEEKDKDKAGMAKAADDNDEPAMARASGRPDEAALAREAGFHGVELMRLGYTLSHVVHAYGAICQSITELAAKKIFFITASEFNDLNRCLDIAIAGAVTEYQALQNNTNLSLEVEHLGFLAHELRNALMSINISLNLIKKGTVGFGGNTGQVLEKSLKRIEEIIDRSLTEVRLRADAKVTFETGNLLQLVDQIAVTAEVEAQSRSQTLEIRIDPKLEITADQQLYYSALSNLIQNALKYTHEGGKILVRGKLVGKEIVVEVEDECGGLKNDITEELFKPYTQQHDNKTGLGLGLTIAKRAIELNHGKIEVNNLPGKGCVFKISTPQNISADEVESLIPAATKRVRPKVNQKEKPSRAPSH